MLVGMIWVVLAFCGTVRDYVGVTLSFLLGLTVSVLATVGLAIFGGGPMAMVWGFLAGLAVTFFGLTSRVLATFPQPIDDLRAGRVRGAAVLTMPAD